MTMNESVRTVFGDVSVVQHNETEYEVKLSDSSLFAIKTDSKWYLITTFNDELKNDEMNEIIVKVDQLETLIN